MPQRVNLEILHKAIQEFLDFWHAVMIFTEPQLAAYGASDAQRAARDLDNIDALCQRFSVECEARGIDSTPLNELGTHIVATRREEPDPIRFPLAFRGKVSSEILKGLLQPTIARLMRKLEAEMQEQAAAPSEGPKPQATAMPQAAAGHSSTDEPIRFTDEQRELFKRVAALIRSHPQDFREAGQWLDAGACLPKTQERIKRNRTCWLGEARSRRQIARSQGREAGRAYLVPPQGRTLTASRIALARRIRAHRNKATSDPTRYEIVDAAAHAFVSEPPNYDAMRPDLAKRQARRVLLTAWILTDTADLRTTPGITSLQDWAWQQTDWELSAAQVEFLVVADDGQHRPIPRLYARTTLLDDHLIEWMKLVGDALRASMLATPAAPAVAGNGEGYTVAALRDMTGLANTALNKYAKLANVPTPPRGKRNHRYTAGETRAILQAIITRSSEADLVNRCRDALEKSLINPAKIA